MFEVIQAQMATVLSDNRKIQRDLETLKESINMQDRELKQTQQQLTKAVAQSDLLRKELDAALYNSGESKRKSIICGVSRMISNNREFKQIATAGADTAAGSKFPQK